MADKSKAVAIRDEVTVFLEEQRLYFKGLRVSKEIEDERLRQEANDWTDGDKEA